MSSTINLEEIGNMLKKRVSALNAKMLLNAAASQAGLQAEDQDSLTKEQIEVLCLTLINRGGPSFQVGKEVYSKYVQ